MRLTTFILFIITVFSVTASLIISTPVDHAKRGIICNLQPYEPETAKHDIDMCRKGYK